MVKPVFQADQLLPLFVDKNTPLPADPWKNSISFIINDNTLVLAGNPLFIAVQWLPLSDVK